VTSITALAAGAGFLFVTLALFVQGFLPSLVPAARTREVSRAVRTDLGDVKWLRYPSGDYSALEGLGRRVYVREGCWYCHSQYVRPVAGEAFRWGPVSEAGEYAWDLPHLLSTRRIGPDLSRVGLKYSDDWHYAHHWDPRLTVPDSIMPRFPWLFTELTVPVRRTNDGLSVEPTAALRRVFTFRGEREIHLFPDASGLTFVPPRPDGQWPLDGTPVLDLTPLGGQLEPTAVRLVVPTRELVALVRYLQKLGTSRGAWREVFEPQNVGVSAMTIPTTPALVTQGREVYDEHCIGCHGPKGDGNGPAATFLFPRPRNFTAGVFKFRTTPSGSLPTDGDLYRTITRGVRWTAMPTWHEVPDKDRVAVIAFIKTLSRRWKEERLEPAVPLPPPPPATPQVLARGRDLYQNAKCWECHGSEGRGDGPSAAQLKDDFDLPIRPTDFTRGQLKGGAQVSDVYRALTLGLDGTPMPSFADALDETARWALAYYILSLSAWVDPLTGQKLAVAPEIRAILSSPSVVADQPGQAWGPSADDHRPGRRATRE
jgi:cytochrome c oxidase cbb3-type subunit I/II